MICRSNIVWNENKTYVSDKNVRRLEFPNIYSKHKRFDGLEEIQKNLHSEEAIVF